jgi:hypothetical protein
MSYVNPNGQTAPSIGDVVLVVPFAPTMEMQSQFYGQVTGLPDGVNALVRSTQPPNHVYKMSIALEVQYTTVTAAQVGIGRLVSPRNYP